MPSPKTLRINAATPPRVEALFNAGMSVTDVADLFGVSARTIGNIADRHSIALPQARRRRTLPAELTDRAWLAGALADGATGWTIADQLNATPATCVRYCAPPGSYPAHNAADASTHDSTTRPGCGAASPPAPRSPTSPATSGAHPAPCRLRATRRDHTDQDPLPAAPRPHLAASQ